MKALMLNPVSWKELVKKYGVKKAAEIYKQKSSKKASKPVKASKSVRATSKKGGKTMAKKAGEKMVTETTLMGKKIRFKTPMPASWVRKWKKRYEEWVKTGHPIKEMKYPMPPGWQEAYQAGLKAAFGQPLEEFSPERIEAWRQGVVSRARHALGQPLEDMPRWWIERWKEGLERRAAEALSKVGQPLEEMPASWRKAWARGMLEKAAPKLRKALGRTAYEHWRKRMEEIAAGQPLALAGTLRQVASINTIKHILAGTAGIASTTLAPMAIEKALNRTLGTYGRLGVGAGAAVGGFVGLSAAGQPALARTFLASALGGMLASYVLSKFGGAAAGLGATEQSEIQKAVEEEVAKTLAEEGISGIGQLTAEEVEELSGGVGDVGQLTAEEVEELSGVELE